MKCIKNWGYEIRISLFDFDRKRFIEILGKIFAVLGVLLSLSEGENLIFNSNFVKFFAHKYWIEILIVSIIYGILKTRTKLKYQYSIKGTDIKLCLSVGDVLRSKAHGIVIPTNTTFDTLMENDFISIDSVQGQFQQKYFKNNFGALDALLEEGLDGLEYITLEKRKTKIKQYAVGTVSKVNYSGKHYYFAAIADVNEHGKPVNPKFENIQETLIGLWDCLGSRGHMEELAMPILGTGKAGIPNISREKVIKEVIFSIVATSREKALATCFNIVIHPSDLKNNQLNLKKLAEYLHYMCEYRYEEYNSNAEGRAV